jgi:two-component system, chemotaxis family, sensor kinase CheA
MSNDNSQLTLLAIFITEAQEHLDTINQRLPLLEKSMRAEGTERDLREMFRAAHTLKGAAGAADIDEVRILAHQLEIIFEQWRRGELAGEREIFDLVQQTLDTIHVIVHSPESQQEAASNFDDIYRRLWAISQTALPTRRGGQGAARFASVNHEE